MSERKSNDPASELRALHASLRGGAADASSGAGDVGAGGAGAGVDAGAPARAYLLRGEERWFREQAFAALRARARALEWELCAHDTADPDFALSALIDDLSGSSMFASARMVLLRGTTRERVDLFAKADDGKPSALTRAVQAWLESGACGCFVLSADSMRADHAVAKAIQKAGGRVSDFRKLYDSPAPWKPDPRQTELVQWLLARAREKSMRLAPDDALYLAAMTGNDLAALDGALDKLALAGPGGVRAVAVPQASTSPWVVAEQLAGGDLARALFGLETLFHNGFEEKDGRRLVDPTALLGMLLPSLVRSARANLAACECLERGGAVDEAAARAGFSGPPQRVADALEKSRSRAGRAWRRLLRDATELERRAKSGGTVDVNDLAWLALKHRAQSARAGAGAAKRATR